MARLIDADALIEFIDPGHYRNPLKPCFSELDLVNMIKSRPTIKTHAVVYGRWDGTFDGYADGSPVYDVWNCSECGYCIDDGTDDPDMLPNFCPNCGARMDGKEVGE